MNKRNKYYILCQQQWNSRDTIALEAWCWWYETCFNWNEI